MNNQECKERPQIVNVHGDDPVFFPFSIKTGKCSGSYSNINNPYGKLCVSDVVKNVNVKVFNLMSRTNETRHIEWYETCKCKCRLDATVRHNKQRWNNDKCRCECKELIDKGVDYKKCKCKKRLVNKLAEECTENIEETRLVKLTSTEWNSVENKRRHNSCILYIVSFSIIFLISIGISCYFYWYAKKMLLMLSLVPVLKQQFNKLINGRSQTNRDQK